MDNLSSSLDLVFGALADPTRRAVLERLGEGEASIGELAQPFDMALPSLMKHVRVLERAGAFYASLSGSGSALYGLFRSRAAGQKAAARLQRDGVPAVVTTTLTRRQYWRKFPVSGF